MGPRNMAPTGFPSPQPDDAEDVVLALDLGRSLWTKGDTREALRWLRRAAAAAEATGNDIRGVRLAAVAADIATEFAITSITPPPPPVARKSSGPPPLPRSAPPPVPNPTPRPPPVPEPTPPPVRVSTKPPVRVSTKPPPLPPAPPPPSTPPPVDTVPPPVELSEAAQHNTASSLPPVALHADDDGAEPRRGRANALRSYRVFVEQAPDGGLKVHPLRDGARPPAGAREAILVVADHGGSRHPPKGD
jgi:hypothetical protein